MYVILFTIDLFVKRSEHYVDKALYNKINSEYYNVHITNLSYTVTLFNSLVIHVGNIRVI